VSGQPKATSLSRRPIQNDLRLFDGLPAESASALEHWLEALAALPLDRWIALGRACARDTTRRERRATATALLEAIVADQQLELTAWFIGDMVQTTAYAATTAASCAHRSKRRAFAEARAAADWAALAIATQTWLPRVDRDALCAPFDTVIGSGALRLV
jgi:hypothetical protein